jgi:hypothetical protein
MMADDIGAAVAHERLALGAQHLQLMRQSTENPMQSTSLDARLQVQQKLLKRVTNTQ